MRLKILILALVLVLVGVLFLTLSRGPAPPESSTMSPIITTTTEATPPLLVVEPEGVEVAIISVYDNYQVEPGLRTAWGFACVVRTPEEQILFDTGGNSEILLFNMRMMNIDPGAISKVVISHIHGDHIGGLEGFLEENSNVTVYIPASFPDTVRDMITRHGAKCVDVSGPMKISDFVYTTGELYGPPEEQSLIVNSKKGLVVITGCAHPGIVNIVRRVEELTGRSEVYLVVGGFHHPPVSVVDELRVLGVKKAAPSHCTGDFVRGVFREKWGNDFIEFGVGKMVEIDC